MTLFTYRIDKVMDGAVNKTIARGYTTVEEAKVARAALQADNPKSTYFIITEATC